MSERFDLIVIGAGSAARDAANTAAHKHGARVALIEKRALGRKLPQRRVQADEGLSRRRRAGPRRQRARAQDRRSRSGPPRSTSRASTRARSRCKKPQEKWVEELREPGLRRPTTARRRSSTRARCGWRARADGRPDPDRHRLAHGGPADRGHRRRRLARPRLGARADRAAGVAARRRRRARSGSSSARCSRASARG